MGAVAVQMDDPAFAALSQERQLRRACNEFIGMAMFSRMLKQARSSTLNSDLFSSPGERVFQSRLDDVMLQQAASDPRGGGMFGSLGDALYRSLSASLTAKRADAGLDVEG